MKVVIHDFQTSVSLNSRGYDDEKNYCRDEAEIR
jgi:hypothetical protein